MGMEMAIKPSSSFASLGAFPVCVIGCCVRVGIRSPHGTLVKNIKWIQLESANDTGYFAQRNTVLHCLFFKLYSELSPF